MPFANWRSAIAGALTLSFALLSSHEALAQWVQQGSKRVGGGSGGPGMQGSSVALSGNGLAAIVGGPYDDPDGGGGAAWIFTRPATGSWPQQGAKLVARTPVAGLGTVGPGVSLGSAVALSHDGDTAIV